jgi:CO/xanthine dehydrogenase Mo-binding subunit
MAFAYVGKPCARVDALEKVTGRARYAADYHLARELTAKSLYSPVPRARISRIDTAAAASLPGVALVITAEDVPGENDMDGRFPVFARGEAKYIGDALAAVAAETKEIAEQALKLIEVEYEELPGIWTLEQAMDGKSAFPVHAGQKDNSIEGTYYPLRKGDILAGFKEAEVVLERLYTVGFAEQAYIEPESVIALPAPFHRGVEIYGCIQNPFTIRTNIAKVLGIPQSQVRVVPTVIGGSFGGKDESVMNMSARCSIMALKTGRPVRMDLSREECFRESCKRHPFSLRYSLGLGKDGSLRAIKTDLTCQGGAYNNKARFLNWRAVIHTAGPYRIPNIQADVRAKYTNTIYGGAYRGFSGPQVLFGIESLIDEAAAQLGRNPKDFRLQNVLRLGDTVACGQFLQEGVIAAPLATMIEETSGKADFDQKWLAWPEENKNSKEVKKGIGIAITYRGAGLGGEGLDTSSAMITICHDGSINLFSGHNEMGQGMRTAHSQIAAEALGVHLKRFDFRHSDTSITPDSGPTVASRGTQSGGRAVLHAARQLKARLLEAAAIKTGRPQEDIDLRDDMIRDKDGKEICGFNELVDYCRFPLGTNLSAQGWYNPGLYHIDHDTQQGACYQTYTHGVAISEISVDMASGKIRVDKMTVAYELGQAINPQLAYGQFAGGLMQGMGYAIFEELEENEGYLRTLNFDDYLIPTIVDVPEIDIKFYDSKNPEGPYGAKGIGEIGVELSAPSIGNALFHATGLRLRDLPFNLERVLLGKTLTR